MDQAGFIDKRCKFLEESSRIGIPLRDKVSKEEVLNLIGNLGNISFTESEVFLQEEKKEISVGKSLARLCKEVSRNCPNISIVHEII